MAHFLVQTYLLRIWWNPNPYLFELGSLKLKWYGVLFALAVLAGYWVLVALYRHRNLPVSRVAALVQYQFLGGLVGARLGQVLFYELSYYLAHPAEILLIWHGGLASHGAAIGGFVATWLYVRRYKELGYLQMVDVLVAPAALIGALIRIGNLFNSEIIGKVSNVPWAFVFVQRDMQPRHPSQLYEAIMLTFVFALLFYLQKKRTLPTGLLSGLFFTITFTLRYLLEFFKENAAVSQPLNLLAAVLGAALIGWVALRKTPV
ncbi:prolipoprotein diacylglyceryl transferase [Sphingobacteriales bacterium UPWRP_1]|nr:prolipoprotein diacylglyceryl transferase [Sphingobacteriales bacterium TSM_CSS]PSJ78798.1 prolipoprotein diacylglyceryl transferase [Sphingobacteriales bacterium UPWRP_1]